ncbi:MAG: sensor histidine kinase [Reinekea sp.]|nr:sensor histidine kinase [Reinekea sp.]
MPIAKLKRQLSYLSVLMISLSAFSSALVYSYFYTNRYNELATSQQLTLNEAVAEFRQEIGDAQTLLRVLRFSSTVADSLSLATPLDTKQLSNTFLLFGEQVPNITQLRWLDSEGMERVRVDFFNGMANIRAENELQNKSHRYYFQQALYGDLGDIYVSRIDLNVDNGEIEIPYQPTVRIAIHTGVEDTTRDGVLVMNISLRDLLQKLANIQTEGFTLQITDSNGYWILHPQSELQWGNDLDNAEASLANRYPALWQWLSSNASSAEQKIEGALVSHRTEVMGPGGNSNADVVFLAYATPTQLANARWQAFWPALFVFVVLTSLILFFVIRSFHLRAIVLRLSNELHADKARLQQTVTELNDALMYQQQLQDELVESKKLAALGLTVSGVAHELNTPIGGILLSASGLQASVDDLQTQVQTGLTVEALTQYIANTKLRVKQIDANAQRARSVVQSFKRLTYERTNLQLSDFSLATLVDDLIQALKLRLQDTAISIENRVPTHLELYNEYGLMSQLLENLITNSIEHGFETDQVGRILIEAQPLDDNRVEISVSDNGNGIRLGEGVDIFDPFVTGARGKGHIGLGMHLVHQWVTQSMQGTIRVETPDTGGCRMVIRMPVRMNAHTSEEPA